MLMAPQPQQLWLGLVMSAAMLLANTAVAHQHEKGKKAKRVTHCHGQKPPWQ